MNESTQAVSAEVLKRNKRKRIFKDNLTLFTMSLPSVVCMIIFGYLPMVGLVIVFKDYAPRLGIFGSKWVGLENFKFIFHTQDLWRILRNTVLYSIWWLIVDTVMGPLYALLMYHLKCRRAGKVYQTIMQIPRFFSIVIVSYMTYAFLSPTYGILNQIITGLGGDAVSWYQEAALWPLILTIVRQWMGIGGGFLIYYSILLGVDDNLFDAAIMDGANTFQKCWHIAIPAMLPMICMNLIFAIGGILGGDFGLHYNITQSSGFLFETTDIIGTYVYRGLMSGDMSRSAAIGFLTSIIGLVLLLTSNAIVRKVSPENAIF